MPNINLNISSLSILFIAGLIAISIWFPDKPFTSDFAYALFYWFLALGVVRWIEMGIIALLPSDLSDKNRIDSKWAWAWYLVSLIGLVFQVGTLVVGVLHFFSGLSKL